MKINKRLIAIACCLFTTTSYAMLCPSNFKEIYIGDSLETVLAQCGAPASQTTSNAQPSKPQEWVYYIKMNPTDQLFVRTTVAVVEDKVANITVNGISLANTAICGGNNIQVGDTAKAVKSYCGDPAVVNETNAPPKPSSEIKTTLFIYMSPNKTVLTFENGKLKSRS
ncbi:MAG: DUF2845 domain-containing protein [Gammaproteobacteria bacterium]|nr:DUF2845 domain-containing protein [Gammaproteobacteria bacterium]